MTSPFATPGSASGVNFEDLKGCLLLITPHAVETGIKTSFGEKEAVRADLVVLDGDNANTEYNDTLIFPSMLIGQLRSRLDQKVLGRLGQGQAKPGQKPPWLLQEASAGDQAVGMDWLARSSLATPAAAGSNTPPF